MKPIKIPAIQDKNYSFTEVIERFCVKSSIKKKSINLYNGDCFEFLKTIEDNSVDFILTDPPYFLSKLGDDWDNNKIQDSIKKSKTIGGLPVGMKFDKEQGKRLQDFFIKFRWNL